MMMMMMMMTLSGTRRSDRIIAPSLHRHDHDHHRGGVEGLSKARHWGCRSCRPPWLSLSVGRIIIITAIIVLFD